MFVEILVDLDIARRYRKTNSRRVQWVDRVHSHSDYDGLQRAIRVIYNSNMIIIIFSI